mmetsp:Transcript_5806/g.23999  ORF Transcript_5806/g.23999 Transcript_5806/m.23999 type:complete len:328 (-) Transcript_5806:772-1755(-)
MSMSSSPMPSSTSRPSSDLAAISASMPSSSRRGSTARTCSGPRAFTAAARHCVSCARHARPSACAPISPNASRQPPRIAPAAAPRRSNAAATTGSDTGHAARYRNPSDAFNAAATPMTGGGLAGADLPAALAAAIALIPSLTMLVSTHLVTRDARQVPASIATPSCTAFSIFTSSWHARGSARAPASAGSSSCSRRTAAAWARMRDTARVGRRMDSFCAAVERGPIAAAAVAAVWLDAPSAARSLTDAFGTAKPLFPAAAAAAAAAAAVALAPVGWKSATSASHACCVRRGSARSKRPVTAPATSPAADPSSSPRMSFSATSRWRDS